MTQPASAPPREGLVDPELSALPAPRRPFRTLTLAVLAATALGSIALAAAIREPVRYALRSGPPVELGELSRASLGDSLTNAWVHATGGTSEMAAEYHRPLDPDTYRLVRATDAPNVFVELRIPKDLPAEHYLPPASFVGRLVPIRESGPERAVLEEAATTAFGGPPPPSAWVLQDGQAPASSRWALGLGMLLCAFFGFSIWGLVRLLTPPRASTV